jgi:thiamine-phosphate pyrophosphorylase
MNRPDISLYGILDAGVTPDADFPAMAVAAAKGGATLLQLRAKDASDGWIIETARAMVHELASFNVPLLLNDRVELVAPSGADGAHVGQDDMPVHEARRWLGHHRILGLTVKNEDDAVAAPVAEIDYACIGGVFATSSKNDNGEPIGLNGWKRCATILRARRPELPIGAIAGIGPSNAADVIAAGADGIAVVSAMFVQPDVAKATAELAAIVAAARAARRQ